MNAAFPQTEHLHEVAQLAAKITAETDESMIDALCNLFHYDLSRCCYYASQARDMAVTILRDMLPGPTEPGGTGAKFHAESMSIITLFAADLRDVDFSRAAHDLLHEMRETKRMEFLAGGDPARWRIVGPVLSTAIQALGALVFTHERCAATAQTQAVAS